MYVDEPRRAGGWALVGCTAAEAIVQAKLGGVGGFEAKGIAGAVLARTHEYSAIGFDGFSCGNGK